MTYEDFLVMAHGSKGLEPKYNVYLEYVEVLEFVKAYANNNSDVFGLQYSEINNTMQCFIGDSNNDSNKQLHNAKQYGISDLELKTDSTTRVAIKAGGDIELGNPNASPVKVSVKGKLAIGVNNPDSDVDLHVRGAIKFDNKKHLSGTAAPTGGQFNQGDIVWNSNPTSGRFIGWVCVKAGGPGLWTTFGPIT